MSIQNLGLALVASAGLLVGQCEGTKGACTSGSVAVSHARSQGTGDIVDTAVAAGQFNTLVAAVKAAGLVETLKGTGPFTVFAPTDAAFKKLPAGTVESLLKPENKDKLVSILTYHVVPGSFPASEVVKRSGAFTANGQRIAFKIAGDAVMVQNASVAKADVSCSNGVIHVIDTVILPTDKSIVDIAAGAGTFNTLIAAAKAAGLAETLATQGPFTVFAPTDEAFAKLPAGTVESLLKPENKAKLAKILTYHVVAGRVDSIAAASAHEAKTLEGSALTTKAHGASLMINKATVVAADLDAKNGIVHVIDSVLLPE